MRHQKCLWPCHVGEALQSAWFGAMLRASQGPPRYAGGLLRVGRAMNHRTTTLKRILAWNIRHGGGRRAPAIVDRLLKHAPAVIVLTEFRYDERGELIRARLKEAGYEYESPPVAPSKSNVVFVCSRDPFSVAQPIELAGYERRYVWAKFDEFDVCGLYFPQQRAKGPLFNGLLNLGVDVRSRPTLLVGDFNTGQHLVDEEGATFYCADKLQALLATGWIDVWRSRNPQAREYSWVSTHENGFRIDLALASASLNAMVERAFYSHEERLQKVSDHSMLVVDCVWPLNNRLPPSAADSDEELSQPKVGESQ